MTETISEKFSALSKDRKEILRLLREQKQRQNGRISPRARGDTSGSRAPASLAQQRLWFLDQLEGGRAGYQVPVAVRLRGKLDPASLQRSLDALIARHEVLRTVFLNEGSQCLQDISAGAHLDLDTIDLSGCDEEEREAKVRSHKIQEAEGPFDLRNGPLIRARLLRLRADEHVLIVTLHHIIADGWSKGVLIRELAELYESQVESRPHRLPELPVQYADFAQWQRDQVQNSAVLGKHLQYWRAQLQGLASQLELPTDRPRPTAQSFRGGNARVVIGAELARDLRGLARRRDMTLFMVLYAAWSILLARLSGQEDIAVGTPIANRQSPEVEGLIGLFVNTLVLRAGVSADVPVAEFLRQVKEVTLGAFDHQHAPFEKVVDALQPQRSLSHSPLFQVMFVLHSEPRSELRLPGLTVAREEEVDEPSILDLWLSLEERDEEIVGSVNFAADLFDRETVDRWIACLIVLLKALAEDRPRTVGELPILPEQEREKVIRLFNPPEVTSPDSGRLIHELFEEQVARAPDAVAVVFEGQSLTYSELNARANQLARHLRQQGVGADDLVALYLERSLQMVVGILGILKAGGAYVPLDPNYPRDRLQYMLDDSRPKVLVTERKLVDGLPMSRAAVLELDTDWGEISRCASDNLDATESGLRTHHLAYVIYTSGSTGKPKGVMIEHRNVTRLLSATAHWFRFSERDVWTLFHSIAFDFSVWELWGALLYGGRVVVVPYLTARSPQDFYRLVCDQRVTVLNQTPSAFAQFIDAQGHNSQNHCLRTVVFGGEALELHALRPWARREANRETQLINMYGITETTVHVTYRPPLTVSQIETERGSGIGRPIPDLRVYLLDANREPVPIGVAGEIHVGGAGVARGYLNRESLTVERFLTDPFSALPGARMYKSGDLARWKPDGSLEYLGRNDHQVKLRGFRIELGEIEAQLARHPLVKDAVVLAREDAKSEKRLVAYLTPRGSRAAEPGELREHLRTSLPEYMVPSAFVTLEAMPLTANGKLDRRALPAPDVGAFTSREFQPPQGALEETLAEVWRELLSVERVGRNDNFFELGGHSLLIVQMQELLRRRHLAAHVRSIYLSPTLASLARELASETPSRIEAVPTGIPEGTTAITPRMLPLVELRAEHIAKIVESTPGGAGNVLDIYPLVPAQQGILFHHLVGGVAGDAYARSMLLSFASRESAEKFVEALQTVVDRHDILRTAVLWEQLPQPVQVVCRKAALIVREVMLEQDRDPLEQMKDRMRSTSQRLDLRRAPLLNVELAADRVSARWFALLRTHHLVFDNESLQVMLSEVMACYDGRADELPDAVSYRDHVQQVLEQSEARDSKEFFRRKLGDVEEPSAPFGVLYMHGDGNSVEEASSALDAKLAARLRAQARRMGVTAATLFHAAWALVVAGTTGRSDVVFGTVLLGRMHGRAGTRRVLGMFINTLPLRIRFEAMSVRQLVEQTHRELVELLEHEQASLADAQRCSGVGASGPLFSSLLNYRHGGRDARSVLAASSDVSCLASAGGTSYPIMLSVIDQEEGFTLDVETDQRLNPRQLLGHALTAVQNLVSALDEAPEVSATALSILPETEYRQVVEAFNETQAPYREGSLLHELIEEQVARSPDAVAVRYEAQSLTYAELNRRANQLARHLRRKGVGPDQLVGVCVERSIEMVVGLLGILKAGGAYVPLDPGYPAERLEYMLGDSAPRVLLIQEHLRSRLPHTTAELLALDGDWDGIANESESNLDLEGLTPRNLAYVIYTSGSTGQPKGAMNEHRALVNRLQWMQDQYRLDGSDRVLQKTPFSFDVSVWEFFWPLMTGARLVVARPDGHRDPAYLRQLIEASGVTTLHFVPSMLQIFLEQYEPGWCPSVKHVVCSGEELSPTLQNRCLACLPEARLSNLYGPTEAAIDVTFWECQPNEQAPRVPIGRPISNVKMYVLDPQMRPVPVGVVGELYIGGVGVGRGYLNRPELTRARFVPDPFRACTGAKLYKTGDLGRWREDGAIDYLGRNDHQVKIRGFRIELGEIEAHLGAHPSVKDVVVIAREDVPGEKRLVAYVVPRDLAGAPVVEVLRDYLKARVPEHMVPSAFVALERMPLSPNGKLERKALPAPDLDAFSQKTYEEPQGEVEQVLTHIWCEILRIERVGRQDNFFELGGHSLLGMSLIGRIWERLQVQVSVVALFQNPTIRQLAEVVESQRAPAEGMEVEEGMICA